MGRVRPRGPGTAMKPQTRAILDLLLSKEWVSGNELLGLGIGRYGARLNELKALGYSWDKRWVHGTRVPLYHIRLPERQLTLDDVA
jgi:hypothetical protein